jgi:Glucose/sorbosone dehydrogenases
LSAATGAHATTLQPIGTFDQPVYVTSDPGNPERLFVVEREGGIELVEGGDVSQFADLSSKVECSGKCEGERGLLSIALAPDFDSSGRLYVDYANSKSGTIFVEELTAEPGGKSAKGPPRQLLAIPHPGPANHNGGQLQFGPDGDLYVSTGDGGGGNDEFHNAQNLESLLGKILRIDPRESGAQPYTVPPGNPFPAAAKPANTIWSYGLRNPFRFSFDSLTGDMAIGDVGQSAREEVDFAPSPAPGTVGGAGANYGWNCLEGFVAGPLPSDPQCSSPPAAGFAEPAFDYPHTPDPDVGGESRCAIIGGYVVRDPGLGALYGHYLYADLCSGAIRALQLPSVVGGHATEDCWTGLDVPSPVSFGEDSARRIYVVTEGGGVYRLAGSPPPTCPLPPPATESTTRRTPFVGIKPQRRRVERGKVALLTVWVSPCDKHKGQPVKLLRDGRPNGSKFFDRACTARFLPRVRRPTTFTAVVPEDRKYLTGKSRHLRIRIEHRRHHPRRP